MSFTTFPVHHQQPPLISASTDPSSIRCKTCKVPLPDDTWKNCDRCRRNRTESYHRWRKSNEARKNGLLASEPGPSLPSGTQSSSTPTPVLLTPVPNPGPNTSSRASSSAASPYYRSNGLATQGPPPTSDQPQPIPASAPPQSIHVPEFQWSDELIDELSAMPPRSNFLGKFSVVADPAVDNPNRAHMFADELRARGIPISCVAIFFVFFRESSSLACADLGVHGGRRKLKSATRNHGANAYVLAVFCACQDACRGRFVISVVDDVSHPHGIPGQSIAVGLLHSSG
jgi:hypothetical protein